MMPFIDLAAQQSRIKPQIDTAIAKVLSHGKYIMGPEVAQLEADLCDFVGSKHCITVSNGTDALIAALQAYEVGPGDAIITTPFTFFATVEAIMFVGATPVFADIDADTFNICPKQIEIAIEKTKAEGKLKLRGLMPVDLFGLCCDYESINAIAKANELFVIQDSAQSFAASTPDGRKAPSHGHIGTTSFFPAKPLGCYGDGGAVFTDDDELAARMRSIRVHGKGTDKYDNVRVGQNCRLDTIQAAILIEKLKVYQDEIIRRQQIALSYTNAIEDLKSTSRISIIPPKAFLGQTSAWAQFTIRSDNRNTIAEYLKNQKIPSVVYYRTPAHLLHACKSLGYSQGDFPMAERVSGEVLSLPFHPYLKEQSVSQVVAMIEDAMSSKSANR